MLRVLLRNTLNEKETSFSQEAVEMPNNEDEISNNLKEFGVDVETPDLFNSDQKPGKSSRSFTVF